MMDTKRKSETYLVIGAAIWIVAVVAVQFI